MYRTTKDHVGEREGYIDLETGSHDSNSDMMLSPSPFHHATLGDLFRSLGEATTRPGRLACKSRSGSSGLPSRLHVDLPALLHMGKRGGAQHGARQDSSLRRPSLLSMLVCLLAGRVSGRDRSRFEPGLASPLSGLGIRRSPLRGKSRAVRSVETSFPGITTSSVRHVN